jgi:large subunit ribosomal protein L10
MAISKEKKVEILSRLKDIIKDSGSVVFVNFRGLSVSESTALRKDLRESKVNYLVAKKTLLKKAFEANPQQGDIPPLEGELALTYGKDSLGPAGKVYPWIKKLEGKLQILGGLFEGRFLNKQEMESIAQIPERPVLYAQFVNIINSPIRGLVVSLDQISKSKGN